MSIPDRDLNEMIEEFGLVNPTVEEPPKGKAAPRLMSLDGKRVCFLENNQEASRVVLGRIKEILEQRYQLADSRMLSKQWHSRSASPELIDDIARSFDAVVSGIGL